MAPSQQELLAELDKNLGVLSLVVGRIFAVMDAGKEHGVLNEQEVTLIFEFADSIANRLDDIPLHVEVSPDGSSQTYRLGY